MLTHIRNAVKCFTHAILFNPSLQSREIGNIQYPHFIDGEIEVEIGLLIYSRSHILVNSELWHKLWREDFYYCEILLGSEKDRNQESGTNPQFWSRRCCSLCMLWIKHHLICLFVPLFLLSFPFPISPSLLLSLSLFFIFYFFLLSLLLLLLSLLL